MNTEFFLCLNIEIEEKDTEEFLVLTEFLSNKIRNSEENVSFQLLKDKNKPNTYIILEVWKNEESFQEHLNADYFKQYIPKIGRLYSKFKTTELTQIM